MSTPLSGFLKGSDQAFYSLAVMTVIIGTSVITPVAGIVAMILGMIVLFYLQIFTPVTLVMLMIAIVMGILIAFKVRS